MYKIRLVSHLNRLLKHYLGMYVGSLAIEKYQIRNNGRV